jgi:hypothetical protein
MSTIIKAKTSFCLKYASLLTIPLTLWLSGCGQEGSTDKLLGEFTLDVPVAYIKRPLDSVVEEEQPNPSDAVILKPGGNLYIRDFADPTSPEHNITGQYTAPIYDANGDLVKAAGDVSGMDVSYDGSKIVFAMHVGEYQDGETPSTWNLYEYIVPENKDYANGLIQPVITNSQSIDRETNNDFNPTYLSDGRIVFASDRLTTTRFDSVPVDYSGLTGDFETESRQQILVNLHVMIPGDSSTIEQLTFNQSHDLSPSVLMSGEIVFTRWENARGRNQFSLYKINPDGTGLDVLYGAHSHDDTNSANVFLYAREMQNGRLIATLMPNTGTYRGGELVQIDYKNFTDIDVRKVNASTRASVGQTSLTEGQVPRDESLSSYGRYTTPFPLWDESGRVLVAWAPCEVQNAQEERFFCNDSRIDASDTDEYEPAPPGYGIWMFEPSSNTKKMIIFNEAGTSITNPVALIDRYSAQTDPIVKQETVLDETLEGEGVGLLKIKSVYDTTNPSFVGGNVDIAAISALPWDQRPALFVRIVKPAPILDGA